MAQDNMGFLSLFRPVFNKMIVKSFPIFRPCSSGYSAAKADLTVQCINDMPGALLAFSQSIGNPAVPVIDLATYAHVNTGNAEALERLFNTHHSDKSRLHNYHLVYGALLQNPQATAKLVEIGLGTFNRDVVSNMGREGRPGASLRAFRDFLPNARIYGADIDKRVLFTEDRIDTFFVDQMDRASFAPLGQSLGDGFDLMIDDGLHSPTANIHALEFFLPRIKVNGWAVIEDIGFAALPVWQFVGSMLPENYEATIFKTKAALLFAVQRKR